MIQVKREAREKVQKPAVFFYPVVVNNDDPMFDEIGFELLDYEHLCKNPFFHPKKRKMFCGCVFPILCPAVKAIIADLKVAGMVVGPHGEKIE